MKIGVLCSYKFPEGMAPSIRILSYCKGLVENGVNVEIHSFASIEQDQAQPLSGIIDGVKYQLSTYRKKKVNTILGTIEHQWRKVVCLRNIIKSHRQEKFDFLFFSFDKISLLYFFGPIIYLLGVKILFIGDEFPEPIRQLKSSVPKSQLLLYRIIYKFFCGRILMTNELKKFYNEQVCSKPTYILCSVVKTDRFTNVVKSTHIDRPYLCYMGNMMIAKDNVDNIIDAFSIVSERFPQYELRLYGTPNKNDLDFVKNCIEKHGLSNRVKIMGRVNFGDVPQILCDATILLTSQPITKRAAGGFPTKLAEYMLSHTPAIVTNVGEIHNYVKDGEHVYMVPPCNPIKYAEKIEYILTHPYESKIVSENAYKLAMTDFNAKVATKGLVEFLNRL